MNELDSATALGFLLDLLSPNQAAIAREMYAEGRPLKDIANELGISFNEARGVLPLPGKVCEITPNFFKLQRAVSPGFQGDVRTPDREKFFEVYQGSHLQSAKQAGIIKIQIKDQKTLPILHLDLRS